MSGVPLYISFGANAKKMMTWQIDTAKNSIDYYKLNEGEAQVFCCFQ